MAKHGANGGQRRGAGRPKGSYSHKKIVELEARNILVERVLNNWKPLIDAKVDLALGDYYYEKIDGKGEVRKVYKNEPDSLSINHLIEYVIGKPKASVSLDGEVKTPDLKESVEKLGETIQNILENR